MVRIFIFLLLFLFISFNGFSQNDTVQKPSPEAALEQSKKNLNKAFWFIEIPQYNYDSAAHYMDQAFAQLNDKQPLHHQVIFDFKA